MAERFSLAKRVESLRHAARGLQVLVRSTHNARIELFVLTIVLCSGFYLGIARTEWMMVIFASGLVLVAEAFNTALEIDINLTSPGHHVLARDIKDVAAGAVLLAVITAIIIGFIVFVPYLAW